ncbi:LUD domain-containing protein [Natronolimnobius sp. AArcel1]|uniref:LUD domain-containing protein n=1 Tax=Natronolimnobius sp. AArcel1 TaxID=1679093 RepID=UPI0013EC0C5F|nr:LUD domain-containing protein [Natronolimnobius sp. AArcel1]NGM70362.1 LUD domain-containing protein [Natronolimnobius sp. AArcel1]
MTTDHDNKAAELRHLIETEGETIEQNTKLNNRRRYEAINEIGDERHEALRTHARSIKEDAIERLPELIEQLRSSVEANGGTVYVAQDEADANRYIEQVADDVDASSLVKSKSMTTEELDLNAHLEDSGVDVFETDLGELVIQVADEEPSHIVGPSLHKSREEIAELFEVEFADEFEEPPQTAEELTQFARDYLAERITEADIGMTGANFMIAESGSIALITNEGNARKVVEETNTHIAVGGVEKIIPTLRDLEPFVELVGRSGTGQPITAYTSILSPPINTPPIDRANTEDDIDADPEREFHLVLIDNGRMDMREDDVLRETLYCVRCSACLNSCANFQHVGGHAFGGETYTGGIATGWEAGVHEQESAAEFNDLCTGCSRCVNQCPVKIDIPWINTAVRDRINRSGDESLTDPIYEGLTPDEEDGGVNLQKRLFGNFGTLAKVGSATAPLSNWLASAGPTRTAMDKLIGVDRRRELPTFQRTTLVDWFDARGGAIERTTAATDREVVLYPDIYTNYIAIERGKAAIRALEALGISVILSEPIESGRAPLSQGMIETARGKASNVHTSLVEHIDAGRDVVVIEPSDLAIFRDEYERLLPEASYERLSEHSYEILEYIYGLLEQEGLDPDTLAGPTETGGDLVAYHSHCQQRTLGLEAHSIAVLERLGYAVETSDVECCGMAGSFGYKSQYYELSMDVGSDLQAQFDEIDADHVVASGTSCTEQIESLIERRPPHVIELVAPQ